MRRITKQFITVFILIILGIVTITFFNHCSPKASSQDVISKEPNEYVGNETCKSCHKSEYDYGNNQTILRQ